MQLATATEIFTSGDLARELGRPVSQVRHILNSRAFIEPIGRAGVVRLYGPDAIEQVRRELLLVDDRRRDKGGLSG